MPKNGADPQAATLRDDSKKPVDLRGSPNLRETCVWPSIFDWFMLLMIYIYICIVIYIHIYIYMYKYIYIHRNIYLPYVLLLFFRLTIVYW